MDKGSSCVWWEKSVVVSAWQTRCHCLDPSQKLTEKVQIYYGLPRMLEFESTRQRADFEGSDGERKKKKGMV